MPTLLQAHQQPVQLCDSCFCDAALYASLMLREVESD